TWLISDTLNIKSLEKSLLLELLVVLNSLRNTKDEHYLYILSAYEKLIPLLLEYKDDNEINNYTMNIILKELKEPFSLDLISFMRTILSLNIETHNINVRILVWFIRGLKETNN